jgi:hypothetical protein
MAPEFRNHVDRNRFPQPIAPQASGLASLSRDAKAEVRARTQQAIVFRRQHSVACVEDIERRGHACFFRKAEIA